MSEILDQQWQAVLNQLRGTMTEATFTHLLNSRLLSANGHGWQITVRNELAADWLTNRLYTLTWTEPVEVTGISLARRVGCHIFRFYLFLSRFGYVPVTKS